MPRARRRCYWDPMPAASGRRFPQRRLRARAPARAAREAGDSCAGDQHQHAVDAGDARGGAAERRGGERGRDGEVAHPDRERQQRGRKHGDRELGRPAHQADQADRCDLRRREAEREQPVTSGAVHERTQAPGAGSRIASCAASARRHARAAGQDRSVARSRVWRALLWRRARPGRVAAARRRSTRTGPAARARERCERRGRAARAAADRGRLRAAAAISAAFLALALPLLITRRGLGISPVDVELG
jgi:hypothetical protein